MVMLFNDTFQLSLEEFEDTKGVIRIRKSKKDRQHNGPKKKSTKGQTTIYKTYTKTKDRATRTPQKIGGYY